MDGPAELVQRLVDATNARDIDALVDCFVDDYVNETPSHPARGFRGRGQVRSNWEQIFEFVADLHVEVVRCAVAGDTAWTEWEMRGTRRDLTAHHLRGVILFEVRDGRAVSARFYLEPVHDDGALVDDAVHSQVTRDSADAS